MVLMMVMMMKMMINDGGDDDDDGGDDDGDDDDGDDDGDDDDGDDDEDEYDDDGDDVDVDVDVEEEEEEDDEEEDVEGEDRSQDREARFVRACAVDMYRENAVHQARDTRFGRACAIEMRMDMSQEAFCQFVRKSGKMSDASPAASVLCEPAQSKCTWTCHKRHFVRKFSGKMPNAQDTTSIEHRALTPTVRTPQCGHTVWEKIGSHHAGAAPQNIDIDGNTYPRNISEGLWEDTGKLFRFVY